MKNWTSLSLHLTSLIIDTTITQTASYEHSLEHFI